jgi:hypothetical protein
VGEGHIGYHFRQQTTHYTAEALYDLVAGRYLVMGMKNEEKHGTEYGIQAGMSDFTPAALRQAGVR